MGVSISLLFLRGPSVQETLSELQLAMTAERGKLPPLQRGMFAMVNLPSGFHMIWSNTCDERRFRRPTLAKLSVNGEVVLQSIEEHVNFSHVEYWQDGAQIWSVSHSGDVDVTDLRSTGQPPDTLNTLRQEQAQRAHEGDFFEIPIHMGDQLTRYRYDRQYDWMSESPYTTLGLIAPAKSRNWKFWQTAP